MGRSVIQGSIAWPNHRVERDARLDRRAPHAKSLGVLEVRGREESLGAEAGS